MRTHLSLAALLLGAVLTNSSTAARLALSLEISKIDPQPVLVNQQFEVVVSVSSTEAETIRARVALRTDLDQSEDFELKPNERRTVVLRARLAKQGEATLKVSLFRLEEGLIFIKPESPAPIPRKGTVAKLVTETTATVGIVDRLPLRPTVRDISPTQQEKDFGGNSEAGVIERVMGNQGNLFAVSKTAGIWRSTNGQPWTQLKGSPARSYSLAINPSNRSHLVVGERPDDVDDQRVGRSALWQSRDNGNTWQVLYELPSTSKSQGITSIAFGPTTQTLFFGTSEGVARWSAPQQSNLSSLLEYPATARGQISAIAIDRTRVWARTVDTLMFSDDDGKTWTRVTLPIKMTLRDEGTVDLLYDTSDAGPSDRASLAAFDDRAFLIFAPGSLPATSMNVGGSPMLSYEPAANRWRAQWTNDGDGRGLNGRRFVRTFRFNCAGLADTIGEARMVVYSSAQGLQQSTATDSNGDVVFDRPVLANFAQSPKDTRPKRNIHSDLWDVEVEATCPPSPIQFWVASDGGIYRSSAGSGDPRRLFDLGWSTRSSGLSTHNIHGAVVLKSDSVSAPAILYATGDNDAWWRRPDGQWFSGGYMADANFVAGNGVTPTAFSWRDLWTHAGSMISFGSSNQATERPFRLNVDGAIDGPTRVQAIVPAVSEAIDKLQVVMLTSAPVRQQLPNQTAATIGGNDAAGRPWPATGAILLRTNDFGQFPDGSGAAFAGWFVEQRTLPNAPTRFWPFGGTANTRYFVQADVTAACPSGLFLAEAGQATCRGGDARLERVREIPVLGPAAHYGPLFVEPLEGRLLIGVYRRATGPITVGISWNSGRSFCDSPTLTALLTESGRYPLNGIGADNATSAVATNFHGPRDFVIPGSVTWDRSAPTNVVVVSPHAIVTTQLRRSGPAEKQDLCQEPVWRELTSAFGVPRPYFSTVSIDGDNVYVATQGRGLLFVENRSRAQIASWIQRNQTVPPGAHLAVIRDGRGEPIAWGRYALRLDLDRAGSFDPAVCQLDRQTSEGRADENGLIKPSSSTPACPYVATVEFLGDGVHAPASTRFLTVIQ